MDSVCPANSEDMVGLSADLLSRLLRVSQVVRLRFNDWLGDFDLTDGRHSVLTALARAGDIGCSQADLAVHLGQSESNVSTLIERMQRDGLVNRSHSDSDRRKRVLRITSEGQSLLAKVEANRTIWADKLLNGFHASELTRMASLLQKLGAKLDPTYVALPEPVALHKPADTFDATISMLRDTNPANDPKSPQFALRRMLQELSASAVIEFPEKGAA